MNAKILTIDDSPSIRKIIKNCLQDEDYIIEEAGDGVEALEKFKENQDYSLLIVDVHMPKMDGLTLIKEIRKINDNIPIITLTTENHSEKKAEGQQAGANGWIIKPFNPEQFKKVVRRFTK